MLTVFHDAFPRRESHLCGIVDVRFPTRDWRQAWARFGAEPMSTDR